MAGFATQTEIALPNLAVYWPSLLDRLESFDAAVERQGNRTEFAFREGRAALTVLPGRLALRITADTLDTLSRVREIVAGAVVLYAKADRPNIVWTGDLADDRTLSSFRLMRVTAVDNIAPRMRRVRLAGQNLARFESLRGLHLRLLLPTRDVPRPVWPVAAENGLVYWPDEERKPCARIYTVRRLDVEEGWMDIDFVLHDHEGEAPGIGCGWALKAAIGDEVGVLGPLGRPVREADWYVMGCDETGLPALSRILEAMPATTRGHAFVEVDNEAARMEIAHPPGLELRWIYRDAPSRGLADTVCAVEWPEGSTFGWFAGEAAQAERVRAHWRGTLGFGRDRTLAATYWKRGATGLMAG